MKATKIKFAVPEQWRLRLSAGNDQEAQAE